MEILNNLKYTKEEANDKLNKTSHGRFVIVSEYNGMKKEAFFICNVCKHGFSSTPAHALKYKHCPNKQCSSNNISMSEVQSKIDKVQDNRIKIITEFKSLNDIVTVECLDCGAEWDCRPSRLLKSYVGRNCNHSIKYSYNMVVNKIKEKTNNSISMIGNYSKMKEKTKFRCNICGNVFSCTPSGILKGRKCEICRKNRENKLQSLDDLQQEINIVQNNRIVVLKFLDDNHKRVHVQCNDCSLEWDTSVKSILTKEVDKNCNHHVKKTKKAFALEVKKLTDGRIELYDGYSKAHNKAIFRCVKCGYKFSRIASNINEKTQCIQCKKRIDNEYVEKIQNQINAVQNNRIKIIGEFKGLNEKVKVVCTKCGLEWDATPSTLMKMEVGKNCNHSVKITKEVALKRIQENPNGSFEMIGEYKGQGTSTRFRCNKCGYEFNRTPASAWNGTKCEKCGIFKGRRIDFSVIQERIDDIQGGRIKIIGPYKNQKTKTLVECKICGLKWHCSPGSLLKRVVGKNCKHHINYTKEMIDQIVYDETNNGFRMIGKFHGVKTPTDFICTKCGFKFKRAPFNVYHGCKCASCNGITHWNQENFETKVFELTNGKYSVEGIVFDGHTKVKLKHSIEECNNEFLMSPNSFVNQGQRCPKCARKRVAKKNSLPLSLAKKRLYDSWNGEYSIVSGYTKSTGKCFMRHNKQGCNKEFYSVFGPVMYHRSGCPYCSSSYGEEATREYLKDNNYNFKEQYKIEGCKNKRLLPFDFAVFNDGRLLFLIEYQGIIHYEQKFDKASYIKTKKNDSIKLDYCNNNSIPLIRVPYKRWHGRFDELKKQVKSYLDNEINKIDKIK